MRTRQTQIVGVLVVLALMVGCATTPLGKATQAADAQKQLIQASATTVAQLYLDDKIDVGTYRKARDAYQKWSAGETALAKSLSDWKRIQDADSSQRLSLALQVVGQLAAAYFDVVKSFIDLPALQTQIGGK